MIHALKTIACPKASSANVVDGKLILSFPDALTPVVWQMDLTQTKASALEVLEDKTASAFTLSLKNPKGETINVATFKKRENAIDGLMAASKALANAQGQIRPVTSNTNAAHTHQAKAPSRNKWRLAFIVLVLILVSLFVWGSMLLKSSSSTTQPGPSATSSTQTDAVGVPLSADDFLRNR